MCTFQGWCNSQVMIAVYNFVNRFRIWFHVNWYLWVDGFGWIKQQFKLNGTVNRHNNVYWNEDNTHITVKKAVNLPDVNVWGGLCPRELIGPFHFEVNLTGEK
ncbi:hypothetical protein AVEN_269750-1 [Araneus ventricosus]|uniref:Uncharacterized protein n=1 Tax=Araneus ventricosus TaxID=182803 RepID=A0A4Y2EG67_ARAVE|nr:hypothetical protein AVEN_269750-1 [Araneus ventricosus]